VGVDYRHRVFFKKIFLTVEGLILREKSLKILDLINCIHHPNASRDQNKKLKMDGVSLEAKYLVGCNAVYSGTISQTFRKNSQSPFSGLKSEPSKQPSRSRRQAKPLLVNCLSHSYQTTWRHIPHDCNIHSHCRENFISRSYLRFFLTRQDETE
jgi:hypothetical protein